MTAAFARTAALGLLAEAAEHWVEADNLAFAGDPSDETLDALRLVGDRIMREAAAIPADTCEGLRSKALILTRIEALALRDDASMGATGLALLRSVLDGLTREGDAA